MVESVADGVPAQYRGRARRQFASPSTTYPLRVVTAASKPARLAASTSRARTIRKGTQVASPRAELLVPSHILRRAAPSPIPHSRCLLAEGEKSRVPDVIGGSVPMFGSGPRQGHAAWLRWPPLARKSEYAAVIPSRKRGLGAPAQPR